MWRRRFFPNVGRASVRLSSVAARLRRSSELGARRATGILTGILTDASDFGKALVTGSCHTGQLKWGRLGHALQLLRLSISATVNRRSPRSGKLGTRETDLLRKGPMYGNPLWNLPRLNHSD